ncbi:peptidase [Massilia sp. WF1]|uniref:SapC family protein n=1 Tax=unclassified Massilia TaxID=2609279 RepID=UPI00064ACA2F|nr:MULTISPECIES: SapC family protein [unclassified Massilia]ALK97455.1 peptidase [Massilia sp. WG5]KLU36637.1 peptidase [Massilia sp. WF1]
MPNHALLNNIEHKQLRIVTARGAAYGDAVMSALTFPAEFRELQAHYPIVFAKNHDGTGFDPIALFGFQQGENLFLDGGRSGNGSAWDAPYIPLTVERQPFLIGRPADGAEDELMIHVDLDSPRVSTSEGEPLFLSYGGSSEYLERISRVLRSIHDGLETSKGFIEALLRLELLESFVLDIELDDGSQNRLAGFYTIHEERLAALKPEQLGWLHEVGYLQAIYMAVASLSQFRGLIERKNRANAAHR